MSTQIQLRRGTTVDNSTFTGASGELIADTTKNILVLHDGSTVGGHPFDLPAHLADTAKHAGAWQAWTPTLTWTTATPGGTTTTVARYCQVGKIVYFVFYFYSTDGNGATNLQVSLPIDPKNIGAIYNIVSSAQIVGSSRIYPVAYVSDSGKKILFLNFATCTDNVDVTLTCSGFYEIA